MTKKNLKPQQAAPVQRENTATVARATVARDGAIAPSSWLSMGRKGSSFCGRRRRVIPLILTLTSKSVKSLFLSPLAHG
ncbi:Cyanobactin peptide [Planktothrix agardhii]|uniref:Cyanobactin peptide n=1 Tax=Planktothrix agardhii NIES-596 TaxID=443922 RepID=F5B704_PLAAG|nr:cyanobactin precursor peptide [Planktothrix agardhii NIES-596]MCB8765361.1 anacyclamide/piricyclamide family prenylated cyclic peptide [Planktothrix agardhii 1809]MCB8778998.1 anacyclamide/piricyclamide family prenylated cyclic peptide [Planktothrix agardhii 1031]MCB8784673.1 anacyclamide/piricyclamide family prenylated cyclic peptide [Planktothrix agardhii 1808]CAD5937805.1 Cyanobactin peptide [Planktothrix agardhii]